MKPTPAICFAADVKKSRQMEKGRLLSILNEYQLFISSLYFSIAWTSHFAYFYLSLSH
ncbi:hypothetical protein HNR78_002239 [Parageobacillus toebii NBRC 107807]|uniref:Uncharacterized protein n=1 Tax=Parageobacillus toebii NBRC 107807 TaxID=1223503 RepID=A0AA89NKM6_9BACL|nr:hypothetical protein [Parageobacillus toebii NBRC 107807]